MLGVYVHCTCIEMRELSYHVSHVHIMSGRIVRIVYVHACTETTACRPPSARPTHCSIISVSLFSRLMPKLIMSRKCWLKKISETRSNQQGLCMSSYPGDSRVHLNERVQRRWIRARHKEPSEAAAPRHRLAKEDGDRHHGHRCSHTKTTVNAYDIF